MARATARSSRKSPSMISTRSRMPSRLSSVPLEKSSKMRTRSPSRTSARARFEPIKPAPPVIRYMRPLALQLRATAGARAYARARRALQLQVLLQRTHPRFQILGHRSLMPAERPPPPFEEQVAQLVGGRVRDAIVLANLVQRPVALDQLERDGNLFLHGQFLSQSHAVPPACDPTEAPANPVTGAPVSPGRSSSRGGALSGVRQRPAKLTNPFRNPAPHAQ